MAGRRPAGNSEALAEVVCSFGRGGVEASRRSARALPAAQGRCGEGGWRAGELGELATCWEGSRGTWALLSRGDGRDSVRMSLVRRSSRCSAVLATRRRRRRTSVAQRSHGYAVLRPWRPQQPPHARLCATLTAFEARSSGLREPRRKSRCVEVPAGAADTLLCRQTAALRALPVAVAEAPRRGGTQGSRSLC